MWMTAGVEAARQGMFHGLFYFFLSLSSMSAHGRWGEGWWWCWRLVFCFFFCCVYLFIYLQSSSLFVTWQNNNLKVTRCLYILCIQCFSIQIAFSFKCSTCNLCQTCHCDQRCKRFFKSLPAPCFQHVQIPDGSANTRRQFIKGLAT